jgi:hypothetical protein
VCTDQNFDLSLGAGPTRLSVMLLLCGLISVLVIGLVRGSNFHVSDVFKPLLDTKLLDYARVGEFSGVQPEELPYLH